MVILRTLWPIKIGKKRMVKGKLKKRVVLRFRRAMRKRPGREGKVTGHLGGDGHRPAL